MSDIVDRLIRCGCCDSYEGADEIERLRAEIDRKNLTIQALTEERDEVVRMANKLTAERDEARRCLKETTHRHGRLLGEIHARINHGMDSNGQLKAIFKSVMEGLL